jgi:RNA polymerase sigma factor (sigma-70 family)
MSSIIINWGKEHFMVEDNANRRIAELCKKHSNWAYGFSFRKLSSLYEDAEQIEEMAKAVRQRAFQKAEELWNSYNAGIDNLDDWFRTIVNGEVVAVLIGELIDRYYGQIRKYCCRKLIYFYQKWDRDIQEAIGAAEDVTQVVFCRALELLQKDDFQFDKSPNILLSKIAHNKVIDREREDAKTWSNNTRISTGNESEEEALINEIPSRDKGLEDLITEREEMAELNQALTKLSEIEQYVIVLRHKEGYKNHEIAGLVKERFGIDIRPREVSDIVYVALGKIRDSLPHLGTTSLKSRKMRSKGRRANRLCTAHTDALNVSLATIEVEWRENDEFV